MTEPLWGYLSLQLNLIMVVCLECKMVIKKGFFLIPGGNDLDEQVKLQQAMLRRQELLDKIRVSQITGSPDCKPYHGRM